MKCVSCGAEIGFTEGKCPYCGRTLTETASHRADLKKYKGKSKKIKAEADAVVSKNKPLVLNVVVMVLLIICIIAATVINENAYFFKSDALQRRSVKNYEEYSQKIMEYLDAGDYTGFFAFMESQKIAEYKEPYDDLKLLYECAKEYEAMVSSIQNVCINGPEAKIYSQDRDIIECRTKIDYFYDMYELKHSYIDEDPYREYIYDMRDKADAILEIYLGLDEKDREAYFNGSENERNAYIEEVILGE